MVFDRCPHVYVLKAALQQHSHDSSVKYIVLLIWKDMQQGSNDSVQRYVDDFATLESDSWAHLGRLLQSSDRSLANAILCIFGNLVKYEGNQGKIPRKEMRTWLWICVQRYQADSNAIAQGSGSLDFAVRSLEVLVASFLRSCDQGFTDDPNEQTAMIDLLVSLAVDPVVAIAICATKLLASMAKNRSLGVSWYTPGLLTYIVDWLRRQNNAEDRSAFVSLSMMYFKLLNAATNQSARTAASLANEYNCVQLSIGFLMNSDVRLQYEALRLLHAFLQDPMPVSRIRSICSSLRLSGALIKIAWMLGHEQLPVAKAASDLLEIIMVQSPASDLVRALIEQGCVAVFNHMNGFNSDSGCRTALDWVSREMENEHILAVSLNSLRQSSNALLIKNVLLALVILSQNSLKIHVMLVDEHFLTEIAQPILLSGDDNQCDRDAAVALLAFCVRTCDRCSTVKLDTNHQSASIKHVRGRQQSQSQLKMPPPVELPPHIDRKTLIQCVDGITGGETFALYTHCKAIRQWIDAHPLDKEQRAQVYPLDQFQTATVQLLYVVIEANHPIEATGVLKQVPLAQALDLLRLAKIVDSSRVWHYATRSISQSISSETWQLVFHVAVETRHPVLMLRSIQFALGLHDMVEQATLEARDHHQPLKAALQLTAAQMIQELFS